MPVLNAEYRAFHLYHPVFHKRLTDPLPLGQQNIPCLKTPDLQSQKKKTDFSSFVRSDYQVSDTFSP
ncbi:hypothetical protein AD948_12160 [Acetobacter senegalensis]|uniref:Uncharacterized protein n=2 Tax=Acetobacter TaxID=434 RepID=A0A149TYH1_9PROT|nr:hypothetical protein AD948_12160 [Acetobacter senegalensis]GAA08499.1 hypothetical protein ATPR_1503 [Acetobacter tropicalis NBRC 101654]